MPVIKPGESFIVLGTFTSLLGAVHIVLDGESESLCGREFHPKQDWYIGESDGDWEGFCPACVAAMAEEAS